MKTFSKTMIYGTHKASVCNLVADRMSISGNTYFPRPVTDTKLVPTCTCTR